MAREPYIERKKIQGWVPKQLFLLDGLGAMMTALILSQVLARFKATFGMPLEILYVLASIAGCFAMYSLTCHFLIKKCWKPYLKGIAFANILYCVATFGLVLFLYKSLTLLGIIYFLGEVLVVLALVRLELKLSFRK